MSTQTDFSELLSIASEFLKLVSGELDPYTSKKGIIEVGNTEVKLFTVEHIQFAKYGRGAGKPPPFKDIFEYVKEKGIRFNDTDQEGTAWAIVNSISKKGTSNYVPNAPNALDEAIKKHYATFNKEMAAKIKVVVNDDINAAYNKLPKFREFKI